MLFIAGGLSVSQLTTLLNVSDLTVWVGVVVIWSVTAKWRQPAVAQGEDPGRLQKLGRKRSRLLAVGLVAAAVLWPVLDFLFLLYFACDFATC
ncbi:hypothetical protein [Streptomyces griseorubiginosus]|uniref:hypothetical protein n=1 Tax=Streptomyces griseorubiginosus TaxID=67304 RepID=UPI0036E0E3BD